MKAPVHSTKLLKILATALPALLLCCSCPQPAGRVHGGESRSGASAPPAGMAPAADPLADPAKIDAMSPAEAYDELTRRDGVVDCERLIEHCLAGEETEVRLYLHSGGDPNCGQAMIERSTPLIAASLKGRSAIVRLLLDAGARTETADVESETTALGYAAREGQLEVVKLLLEAGADPRHSDKASVTPLHAAAAQGRLEVVKLLLAKGVPVDLLSEKKGENLGGITPLIYAALGGQSEVAHYLIEEGGADPTHIAGNGSSAAMAALHLKNLDLAKYLYSKGSPPMSFFSGNMSTLALAAQIGYTEGVEWLVSETGADVDTPNQRDKATALIVSVVNTHIDCTRRLLELGADPQKKDASGKSALDYARQSKLPELLELFEAPAGGAKGDSTGTAS